MVHSELSNLVKRIQARLPVSVVLRSVFSEENPHWWRKSPFTHGERIKSRKLYSEEGRDSGLGSKPSFACFFLSRLPTCTFLGRQWCLEQSFGRSIKERVKVP